MADDFLSRWSRRKRAASPEGDRAEAEPASEAPPAEAERDEGEETDAQILARLGLKHPEEMGAEDDFAAFLRAAVPRHLKSLAYRRLWRSNPTLACLDGLNDYDGDFTGGGAPAGGLATSYRVGRGILRQIAEVTEDGAEDHGADGGRSLDSGAEPSVAAMAGTTDMDTCPAPPSTAGEVPRDPPRPAARRRMVFRNTGKPRGG